jgi:hypothetical protein
MGSICSDTATIDCSVVLAADILHFHICVSVLVRPPLFSYKYVLGWKPASTSWCTTRVAGRFGGTQTGDNMQADETYVSRLRAVST